MAFCTAINCMDGRTQLPVIEFLKSRFNADHVDMITEPGPNRILAEQSDPQQLQSIFARLRVSVDKHQSVGIAVVGHHDCAGNPAEEDQQRAHTGAAIETIRRHDPLYMEMEIIGLWVDANWTVTEIQEDT